MIQIFGTNKSFDTKSAQRFFKERRIAFQFVDLKEKEMSEGEFDSVVSALARAEGSRAAAIEAMIDTMKNVSPGIFFSHRTNTSRAVAYAVSLATVSRRSSDLANSPRTMEAHTPQKRSRITQITTDQIASS